MRRALLLARRGWGRTAPNPMVGAVLVRDGRVVGEGWHAEYGGAHAEAAALAAAGERARGADLFVTLEPCAHHGKTPPCVDAIIAAGVRRVVVALADPNPQARGGAAKLRAAGIEVDIGVEAEAAAALNAPFLFAHTKATRPFITLKLALSIDGAIAPGGGQQRWLTGEAARRHVHRLRAQADAIGVGIGTALADDPALTVRHGRRPRVAPVRVVFDQAARLPLTGKLARSARKVPVWVLADATATNRAWADGVAGHGAPGSHDALERMGVVVRTAGGLDQHLAAMRADGIRHLFVEGGAGIAGALLTAGWVDRLVIFRAPVLLGAGALSAFGTLASSPLAGTGRWRIIERRAFGDDFMTEYEPPGRDSISSR
ncbi:MAG TPA: bifunctional diaminohydroxyphosphoribosylaminopyrimidine deaminase/5-amino-6-(5-phosphoribosylamino)uracil reductase RibD [Gemmatimonadaceae bacterium]|nr:bifunctional diaminohydroxyphosphoribosylaminopyrimidine deaminase/5-amino-6-(5-phosphoribosylamino)uracil reductase RibD [Gemmatimonadaceae bacterium]